MDIPRDNKPWNDGMKYIIIISNKKRERDPHVMHIYYD